MTVTATKLRQNIYNILDNVIDTGIPVEIERNGVILKIIPEKKISKWDRLEPHNIIIGDPDSIVSIDWSDEWNESIDL